MNPKEKTELLFELAEAKAANGFEKWKEEYLEPKLKHKNPTEAKEFLLDTNAKLEDWYFKYRTPKPLFDISFTPFEKLYSRWQACFTDWKEGLKPIIGTPEYSEESFDFHTGESQGVYIPHSWINALSERMKNKLCREYVDLLLSQNPESINDWKQQKFKQIVSYTKLAIKLLFESGKLPEQAILDAFKEAKSEAWPTRGRTILMELPSELISKLGESLLQYCRTLYQEPQITYIKELIRKNVPHTQQPTTRTLAVSLRYKWNAGYMDELHNNKGTKKEALKRIALENGVSAKKLETYFNHLWEPEERPENKCKILELVIPTLAGFPKAEQLAKSDLEAFKKHT